MGVRGIILVETAAMTDFSYMSAYSLLLHHKIHKTPRELPVRACHKMSVAPKSIVHRQPIPAIDDTGATGEFDGELRIPGNIGDLGVMELVAAEGVTHLADDCVHGKGTDVVADHTFMAHESVAGERTYHLMGGFRHLSHVICTLALDAGGQFFREVHQTATFCIDGQARAGGSEYVLAHGNIILKLSREKFRVAAADVQAINIRKFAVVYGAEIPEVCARKL